MSNGPWSVDDHLLLLKEWNAGGSSEGISFNKVDFWIQVMELPEEWCSSKIRKFFLLTSRTTIRWSCRRTGAVTKNSSA